MSFLDDLTPLTPEAIYCPKSGRITPASKLGIRVPSGCPTCGRPLELPRRHISGRNRLAAWACFLGNIPMGLLLFGPCVWLIDNVRHLDNGDWTRAAACTLLPGFYLWQLVRVQWIGELGVTLPMVCGMLCGLGMSIVFGFIGLFMLLAAGLIGIVLGIFSLVGYWRLGDSIGCKAASLGCIPQILLLLLFIMS